MGVPGGWLVGRGSHPRECCPWRLNPHWLSAPPIANSGTAGGDHCLLARTWLGPDENANIELKKVFLRVNSTLIVMDSGRHQALS